MSENMNSAQRAGDSGMDLTPADILGISLRGITIPIDRLGEIASHIVGRNVNDMTAFFGAPALLPEILRQSPAAASMLTDVSRQLLDMQAIRGLGADEAYARIVDYMSEHYAGQKYLTKPAPDVENALYVTANATLETATAKELSEGRPLVVDRASLLMAVTGIALKGADHTLLFNGLLGPMYSDRWPGFGQQALLNTLGRQHPDLLPALSEGVRSAANLRKQAGTPEQFLAAMDKILERMPASVTVRPLDSTGVAYVNAAYARDIDKFGLPAKDSHQKFVVARLWSSLKDFAATLGDDVKESFGLLPRSNGRPTRRGPGDGPHVS